MQSSQGFGNGTMHVRQLESSAANQIGVQLQNVGVPEEMSKLAQLMQSWPNVAWKSGLPDTGDVELHLFDQVDVPSSTGGNRLVEEPSDSFKNCLKRGVPAVKVHRHDNDFASAETAFGIPATEKIANLSSTRVHCGQIVGHLRSQAREPHSYRGFTDHG